VWITPESGNSKKWVALADSYATALVGLARRAHIQEKDTVLITAAAGGLGLAAVDLASHVYRAKVNTSRSPCQEKKKKNTRPHCSRWFENFVFFLRR